MQSADTGVLHQEKAHEKSASFQILSQMPEMFSHYDNWWIHNYKIFNPWMTAIPPWLEAASSVPHWCGLMCSI